LTADSGDGEARRREGADDGGGERRRLVSGEGLAAGSGVLASLDHTEACMGVLVVGETLWQRVDGRQELASNGEGAERGLLVMGLGLAFYRPKVVRMCYHHKLTGLINGPRASWA
jgi:hypothetical protein